MNAVMISGTQQPQMIDIAAKLVSTSVMDMRILRDKAMGTLVDNPVNAKPFAVDADPAISAAGSGTCPDQAITDLDRSIFDPGIDRMIRQGRERHTTDLLAIVGAAKTLFSGWMLASLKTAHESSPI
jgi:hypothetical protein